MPKENGYYWVKIEGDDGWSVVQLLLESSLIRGRGSLVYFCGNENGMDVDHVEEWGDMIIHD
jgi:hypothetical protein